MPDECVWSAWPGCSQCGRLRQTTCPTCGGAGNGFAMAEYQGVAEPQRDSRSSMPKDSLATVSPVLLICSDCDEAFTPRFYRVCPACGCDAGTGIELGDESGEHVSNRVLLAIYGLAAIGLLLTTYFWLLFRGG